MTDLEAPYDPVRVSDVELAFPAKVAHLMPPAVVTGDAPQTWRAFQRAWFYSGLDGATAFHVREGIDGATAFRHLQAIQGTYSCKHEHKEAAVAFLASLWFVRVVVPSPDAGAEDKVYGEPLVDGDGAAVT